MKDCERIAAEWARDFSCELWTDSPGQRSEDLPHATDEVVIVLESDVRHPQAGQQLFIPAEVNHSARNIRAKHRPRHGEMAVRVPQTRSR